MKKKFRNRITFLIIIFISIIIMFFLASIYHAYKFTHPISHQNKFKPSSMNLPLEKLVITTFAGVTPYKNVGKSSQSDYNLKYENVTFVSRDGLNLRGWFIKSNKPKGTIILMHGWDSNKGGLLNYSKFLNKNGYNTFLFDFRGFGESDGSYTTLGYYERYDVLGAVDYLKKRKDINSDNIGALGFSMGGAAVIMSEKEESHLKAIVLDSTYPTIYQNVARRFEEVYGFPKFPFATSLTFSGGLIYGFNAFDLSPSKYINNIHVPIFFIQGTGDRQVFVDDALILFKKANEPKSIWIVENAKHTESYSINPKEYEKKVIEFFNSIFDSSEIIDHS